jgi:ADP-ribosylglycohydrolase
VIGDALGTPSEGKSYDAIRETLGWIEEFESDGTDDTILKNLLAEALAKTDGFASLDDWAQAWTDNYRSIFGTKVGKFFQSVLHTAAKLRHGFAPRLCSLGNMPSSSSAMAISPIGVVNACNPRAAAKQAYDVASLIHTHEVSFCQDGAAAMAAAVAEAFRVDATTTSILDAAVAHLLPTSGAEMRALIDGALELVDGVASSAGAPGGETGSGKIAGNSEARDRLFHAFAAEIYRRGDFFRSIMCDSRETIPIALALFRIADGNFDLSVQYGANFGRDADTIATMAGAIAGAYGGLSGIRPEWVAKLRLVTENDYDAISESLSATARRKAQLVRASQQEFDQLLTL